LTISSVRISPADSLTGDLIVGESKIVALDKSRIFSDPSRHDTKSVANKRQNINEEIFMIEVY
jgi:hypothetical protein